MTAVAAIVLWRRRWASGSKGRSAVFSLHMKKILK